MFKAARWRLVAWNAIVFAFLLLIIEAAAYGMFNSRIYSGVDADLNHQVSRVLNELPAYEDSPFLYFNSRWESFPPGWRIVVADPSGEVNQTSDCPQPLIMLDCAAQLSPMSESAMQQMVGQLKTYDVTWTTLDPLISTLQEVRTATYGKQPWRVVTFAVLYTGRPIGIFQIARGVSGEEAGLVEMRVLLIFGGILGVLLATFGSLFLANRALVPIRQAFARQRQFTADASHELRTPLTLIRANAEMLYRHVPNDDAELVGEIIRETDHLNRLVGDLLTLARADAESLKLVTRPVDFRALVESVHEDLHAVAASRNIDTVVSLDGPITVPGDEGRLRQLVLILLDNSLKYTDPGGRVSLSVRREDNRARLVVTDSGIGIPPEDLPHIFERFYRVDRAREHESGGTGLGLAIARWIVQAHHGNIRVESQEGHGSRFQVDLPVS